MSDTSTPFRVGPAAAVPRWGPVRVRTAVLVVAPALAVLVALGSFGSGVTSNYAYVASLGMSALVVLLVSLQMKAPTAVAWRAVGAALVVWAVTGALTTLKYEAEFDGIPDLLISFGYVAGYLPAMFGFATLADHRLRIRRLSNLMDGVLLFAVLYGVLWLLVVEQIAADSSLARVDRAFSSIYPAGDLALVLLALRIAAARSLRREVAAALVAGSLMSAAADVWLLVGYLRDPEGSYPITDALYLGGLAVMAVAAMWSLLPAPPPVETGERKWAWLPAAVVGSVSIPPVVLLGVAFTTDRSVSVEAVAIWLIIVVVVLVLRSMAGMRELERAREQATWLASHDVPTGMLQRAAFLHEVSEGTLRDRSGTIMIVEVQGVRDLADNYGYDAAETVLDAVAVRLRKATGDGAVLARLGHDQFVAFLRSTDAGRGRQVASAVRRHLREAVKVGDQQVPLAAVLGVAQADGAVIDVLAGVRRAGEALHHARRQGPGGLAFDADLTGTPLPPPFV